MERGRKEGRRGSGKEVTKRSASGQRKNKMDTRVVRAQINPSATFRREVCVIILPNGHGVDATPSAKFCRLQPIFSHLNFAFYKISNLLYETTS